MRDKECDVLVIGAGLSGVAAAVAAARAGKKVLLCEQNNFPGGEIITGMHSYICGLFQNNNARYLNISLSRELLEALLKNKAQTVAMGRVFVLRFQASDLLRVLKNLLKHKNIRCLYGFRAFKTVLRAGVIHKVFFKTSKGEEIISPRAVVDCSGAVISKTKKAALDPDREKHLGGYCFKIKANCRDPFLGVKIAYALRRGSEEKKVPWYSRFVNTVILNRQSAVIKISMPFDKQHTVSADKQVKQIFSYLRKTVNDLKSAKIIRYGVLLERAGTRLYARKILTQDDVVMGKQYLFDVACKGAWPIEFWGAKGVEYVYCQKDHYDIPNDCLRAKNINNLFAAGRFLGSDIKALASARVAGICLATGEAAGKLAAKVV